MGRERDWAGAGEHLLDTRRAHARAADFTVIALTPDAHAPSIAALGAAIPRPPPVLLLVGNEGEGLSRSALAAADLRLPSPWSVRPIPSTLQLSLRSLSRDFWSSVNPGDVPPTSS